MSILNFFAPESTSDYKNWLLILSALTALMLIIVAYLLVHIRNVITYKNRGIVKQILAKDKCEKALRDYIYQTQKLNNKEE